MARPIALRHQLLAALVVPAVLVIALVAYFADIAARRALEAALGERLCSIAEAAATVVGSQVLFLERGDDEARSSKNALAKLGAMLRATDVERIVIVRMANHETLIDTKGELRIGDEYTRARFDRAELESVLEGKSVSSILFEGPEGRRYKTGYAPLTDENGAVAAYVAIHARASFFDAIDDLRAALGSVALIGLVLLGALALLSARAVAIPLSSLSAAAQRIGEGDLSAEIPSGGPEEAVILSGTMRAMAEALRARDEEMQMMLAGIAHEVRNPLGGIELFGGLLREDLGADDPRRKHVEKILKELAVLGRVVNDFLDFARRSRLETRLVDVSDLLSEVAAVSAKEASTAEVEVTIDAARDIGVEIDPESVKRAVLNLVRNAIQASPRGGTVHVSAKKEGGEISIAVRDSGPGIPAEKRKEIFAPFYTTKQKGTGLGLALVKKTVDAHGGRVNVEDAEGGGARFVISMPVSPPPST